jgi:hypothetical protein
MNSWNLSLNNMMNARLFSFPALLFLLFTGTDLRAQESPPKPSPPFVADAPATSGWKITMTPKRGRPAPDKNSPAYAQWQKTSTAIAEILVSKSGDRMRIVTRYVQGAQAERYRAGVYEYEHKAGFVAWDVMVHHVAGGGDFPELSWLSLDFYKDIEFADGKKYFVFRDGPDGAPLREAWINVVTKLPLKFNDLSYDRVYEFSPTPPIGIEPSEIIAQKVALQQAALQKSAAFRAQQP